MNLQEQKNRIKEIMGLILEEKEDLWLYNWFKNVPEQKIKNTFVKFNIVPSNEPNKFYKFEKTQMTRPEILKILSNKNYVLKVPKKEFTDFLLSDYSSSLASVGAVPLAIYFDTSADTNIKNLKEKILKLYNQAIKLSSSDEQLEWLKSRLQIIEKLSSWIGKVVYPDNLESRLEHSDIDTEDILRHEEAHYLYDMTENSAKQMIRKICVKSKCKGYLDEETEIYAYLFTLRSKFKMQPIDVVEDVKLVKGRDKNVITITVNRGGKRYNLKDVLDAKSATFLAMQCCTGNFAESLKNLHNTLATNSKKTPPNSSQEYMV